MLYDRVCSDLTNYEEAAAPLDEPFETYPTTCAGCVEGWIAPSGEPFDISPTACGVRGRMDCACG